MNVILQVHHLHTPMHTLVRVCLHQSCCLGYHALGMRRHLSHVLDPLLPLDTLIVPIPKMQESAVP